MIPHESTPEETLERLGISEAARAEYLAAVDEGDQLLKTGAGEATLEAQDAKVEALWLKVRRRA